MAQGSGTARQPGEGGGRIDEIAARYRISRASVEAMLQAVVAGGGTMAQFNIPELGGYGQWMRGGMTQVGDMFDADLRARVERLGTELSTLYFDPPFVLQRETAEAGTARGTDTGAPDGERPTPRGSGADWWPAGLGAPASTGSQNDSRYAYFPSSRRLAVEAGGTTSLYDTTGHEITGVGQQAGGGAGTSTFSTARGTVRLDSLPRVEPAAASQGQGATDVRAAADDGRESGVGHGAVLDALERLGTLKEKGVITDAEFAEKKRDLLARL